MLLSLEKYQELGARTELSVLADLNSCSRTQNLKWGKQVHAEAVECGHASSTNVANALITMYAKCGSMVDAHRVFCGIKHPSEVSWTVMILGYADNGQSFEALELLSKMRTAGLAPDSVSLVAALKACTSLALKGGSGLSECRDRGKNIHNLIEELRCDSDIVQGTLIDMYVKCGSVDHARQVFDAIEHPDMVSWNLVIVGYADNGQGQIVLDMLAAMKNGGPAPNAVTFVATLKASISLSLERVAEWRECRQRGKAIHNLAVENGCDSDIYLQNTLIGLYVKCGNMNDARRVFDFITHSTAISWNVLILGYVENGQSLAALDLFARIRRGPAPNSITFLSALKACISLSSKTRGMLIHNLAVESRSDSHIYLQNTLIELYARCGSMVSAHQVFDSIRHATVVSWNTLIQGYVDNGQGLVALKLFMRMKHEGYAPSSVTFLTVLKACTSLVLEGGSALECRDRGKAVHNLAVENGCDSDLYVQNTLIDMYASCGCMLNSHQVFDRMKRPDIVSWNALMLGYTDNGQGLVALDLFTRMKTEGPAPDSISLVACLKACTSVAVNCDCELAECKHLAKEAHNLALGCDDVYVQNTLIDMYAKCGSMVEANQVFESIKHPTVVSWNALILGYAENGQALTGMNLFTRMKSEGPPPDSVTFLAVLNSCAMLGALGTGRRIHAEISCQNDLGMVLVNCLVDFYAKCGSLMEARSVFHSHPRTRNVITWTSLLAGFSSCGDHESVFELFEGMQDAGLQPNSYTFLSVLACCSHAGLVDKGKECFDAMSTKYATLPGVEHYTCMADIFGRANQLDSAMHLLNCMPHSPDGVAWKTILAACRKWKNVEIGRLAFQSLVNPSDGYLLMGQVYGSRGMFLEQEMVMAMRIELELLP